MKSGNDEQIGSQMKQLGVDSVREVQCKRMLKEQGEVLWKKMYSNLQRGKKVKLSV